MKKVTLLNFPVHYYEAQRKSEDMNDLFALVKYKKRAEENKTLEKLLAKKTEIEGELKKLAKPPENFLQDPGCNCVRD